MFNSFLQGLGDVFSPIVMLFIVLGSIIGVIVGVIPTLGAMVACAVLLPFVYNLTPEAGVSFLSAVYVGCCIGGTLTSILMNIPGTMVNVATLFDGFPMTQKGEAGRAIGAALTSALFGGIVAVFLALAMIPAVASFVLKFGSPEIFMLVFLGISFMTTLGQGSMVKGLLSGFLGLVISLVGFEPGSGVSRFTFGTMFLYDGINLIPLVLGLFAVVELVDLALRGTTMAQVPMQVKLKQGMFQGFKDVFRHSRVFLVSAVVGYIVGVIPGIGGTTSTFVAYGQAKRFSRNAEKFGTGCVEGVIAPESANNATVAGDFLTTLAFGIPGNAVMALFLGALIITGIVPGPGMLTDHLGLAFTILIGLAVANLFSVVLCFLLARWTTRIAYIHADYLFPLAIAIVVIGTYGARGEPLDLVVLIIFSVLGLVMKRLDFSRPALVLGFVLGDLTEKYFFISLSALGPLFFLRPISLVILAIIILLLSSDQLRLLFRHLSRRGVTGHES